MSEDAEMVEIGELHPHKIATRLGIYHGLRKEGVSVLEAARAALSPRLVVELGDGEVDGQ